LFLVIEIGGRLARIRSADRYLPGKTKRRRPHPGTSGPGRRRINERLPCFAATMRVGVAIELDGIKDNQELPFSAQQDQVRFEGIYCD
jgi:hypothetical protein